jgi:MoaA/NifB/PqqE/SkfB family radical SAM enzyme
MNCEWCYVPFIAPSPKRVDILKVVERIAALGFSNITFGGGDPFQYKFMPELLRLSKTLGLFVHVDTHAITLEESDANFTLLSEFVDLIGLPLDGSSAAVHNRMRSADAHYELIQSRIRWLSNISQKIKINTIASKVNYRDLIHIGEFIESFRPIRWSIYQYWPIGPRLDAANVHEIPEPVFLAECQRISSLLSLNGTKIEINARDCRRDTYPIIHHDGSVFVHSPAPENQFIYLGSIFSEDTMSKILISCNPERSIATSRYTKIAPVV